MKNSCDNHQKFSKFRNVIKYERYHVNVKEAPLREKLPSKYIVRVFNNCVNMHECVQACVYQVHKVCEDGQIADPTEDLCRGCHLCAMACPKGAISIELNPQFQKMGNSYFTPERIETIFFEAETGRVPVSGAGYGGPFAGKGFDGIWFDFSEIVRPTRDGIHGREYISTSVDLGRKLPFLEFEGQGKLISKVPNTVEIPIPIILDAPLTSPTRRGLQRALAKAAYELMTFAIINAEVYSEDLFSYSSHLIPRIDSDKIASFSNLIKISRIIEVDCKGPEINDCVTMAKECNPSALVSLRFRYDDQSGDRAESLMRTGADIVHFYIDDKEVERNPNIITNAIQRTHSHLVNRNVRNKITFISSGGIAEAAHVSKSIILGADAVSVGLPYQIALRCKVCHGNDHTQDCPIKVEDDDVELSAQRIVNLIGSWRDQLLEILGGMGLREVRRQRGEIGRIMFFEDLETNIFGDAG